MAVDYQTALPDRATARVMARPTPTPAPVSPTSSFDPGDDHLARWSKADVAREQPDFEPLPEVPSDAPGLLSLQEFGWKKFPWVAQRRYITRGQKAQIIQAYKKYVADETAKQQVADKRYEQQMDRQDLDLRRKIMMQKAMGGPRDDVKGMQSAAAREAMRSSGGSALEARRMYSGAGRAPPAEAKPEAVDETMKKELWKHVTSQTDDPEVAIRAYMEAIHHRAPKPQKAPSAQESLQSAAITQARGQTPDDPLTALGTVAAAGRAPPRPPADKGLVPGVELARLATGETIGSTHLSGRLEKMIKGDPISGFAEAAQVVAEQQALWDEQQRTKVAAWLEQFRPSLDDLARAYEEGYFEQTDVILQFTPEAAEGLGRWWGGEETKQAAMRAYKRAVEMIIRPEQLQAAVGG